MTNIYDHYNKLKATYLQQINSLEDLSLLEATDEILRARSVKLRNRVEALLLERFNMLKDQDSDLLGESNDLMLHVLPEAYALAREVTKRLRGMRHYDVQIVSGVALHLGNIVELKNGEGKTIVALLAAYLNALFVNAEYAIRSTHDVNFKKRNVYVMTTNPYLARRDYVWLRPVYEFLGVTVGYLQDTHGSGGYSMGSLERKAMYSADIIYGPVSEFVFDYLRDNNADSGLEQVQPSYYFAIIDEADLVLLDEAQTPHILSGNSQNISNEDIGLIYWATHIASRLEANKSLITLEADNKFVLSQTGREALRIVGKHGLSADPYRALSETFKSETFFLTVVLQFLEVLCYPHIISISPSVYGEISKLSRWSKSIDGEIYSISSQGKFLGMSETGKQYIYRFIELQFQDEDLPIAEQIGIFVKAVQFILKNPTALGIELAAMGITPEQAIALRRIVLRDFINLRGNEQFLMKWIIELVEYYLRQMSEIVAANSTHFHAIARDCSLLLIAMSIKFSEHMMPSTVLESLERVRDELWGQRFTREASVFIAPDALTRIADLVLIPSMIELTNPQRGVTSDNILVIIFRLLFRLMRYFGQTNSPKNRIEREMTELAEEVTRIFNINVYEVIRISKEIRLTRWGEMIVDDYVEQIVASKLFRGEISTPNEHDKIEQLKIRLRFLVQRGLTAYSLYKKDNDYVIQRNRFQEYDEFTKRSIRQEVVIVSQLTGRMQPGRRWSQWLHSFIEAKEGIPVKPEQKSIGRITVQSYLALYPKIAGMTGTAHIGTIPQWRALLLRIARTAEKIYSLIRRKPINFNEEPIFTSDPVETEFVNVYGIELIVVPTHNEVIRDDLPDAIYLNHKGRLRAAVKRVLEIHGTGRPILIETTSISQSEEVADAIHTHIEEMGPKASSRLNSLTNFDRRNVQSQRYSRIDIRLLNALAYEQEAEIISQAGLPGAITVSTQMAGRGTDIIVAKESLESGGLFVLGIQRQDSRRWDSQVSGRSGRQGEKGTSQFYISLEDHLMEISGGKRSAQLLTRLGLEEDIPIESEMTSQAIKTRQIELEHNARIRREKTAGFDQILSPFRSTIYKIRQQTLEAQYLCPLCINPAQKLSIVEESWCCEACKHSLQSTDLDKPLWRSFVGQLITALVDNIILSAKVEERMVANYTSDDAIPSDWNWGELVEELNTVWLSTPISIFNLTQEVDFKNRLYPALERQKLSATIRRVLTKDTEQRLFTEIKRSILRKYQKRDKNLLNWNLDDFARELNESFSIFIDPNKIKANSEFKNSRGDGARLSFLEAKISEAIHNNVSSLDWIYSDEGLNTGILNAFNAFLEQQDKIERSDVNLYISQRSLKSLIHVRMTKTYNRLLKRFGKSNLYMYENKVIRDEIDKQWPDMLVESDLIIEEIRGHDTQEILIQYGVRLGKLLQQSYRDIARNSLHRIFVENSELEDQKIANQQEKKSSVRVYANESCLCGSGKTFSQCCGKFLYQNMPKIISI